MPAVLVHGVPETAAIWEPLRSHLDRDDVVTVALPGFGSPRPDGFGATKGEYVDWLIGELESIVAAAGEPVDLVGHDWGGGFVVRLVSIRPDLVRSWVSDAAAIAHREQEWHEIAKIWLTPGAGEEFWDQQLAASIEDRAALFTLFGVPPDGARVIAEGINRTMADAILDLYRSADGVGREWAPDFRDIPAPGLVLYPADDALQSERLAREAADGAGASLVPLPGAGHWWMLQAPEQGAGVLREFWASLPAS